MKTDFVELVLTCGSWQEAQCIADRLFKENLAENIETIAVNDIYGEIEAVKLIVTTAHDKPSAKAAAWLTAETK